MSNDLFELFGTDKKAEVEGIELRYGSAAFITRRAGTSNKLYNSTVRKVFQPYRRQITNETIDQDVLDELMMRVYFRSVILSWSGVTNKEGEELAYNETNFVWLMQELPDLWVAVQEAANKSGNFRLEVNEADGTALGN